MGRSRAERDRLWSAILRERAALGAELDSLDDADWGTTSLCSDWTVEEVVAHLTAVARTGGFRWIRSMVGARFDTDTHNRRRLDAQLGRTPAETLAGFTASSGLRVAPFGDVAAWLGETIVHSEDIRRPLGRDRDYPVEALSEVARFYAMRDFAVNSATVARGLILRATDGPFEASGGPGAGAAGSVVKGPTLALVMSMAGRPASLDELSGDGVSELRRRIS